MVDDMTELLWTCVPHGELTEPDAAQIARLKDEHWRHGMDSQLRWMQAHHAADDLHLLGRDESGALIAYLTLVQVKATFDGCEKRLPGVGSVCVEKSVSRRGLGKRLMQKAGEYLESGGILLCKETLRPFYEKCGWAVAEAAETTVAGERFSHLVMLYPAKCARRYDEITVDKNF